MLSLAVAAGLTALAGVVGSGMASADDKSYLQKLHDAGINTPRGEYELKEWGWEVCALRLRGKPPRQWVEQAVYSSSLHPPYGLTEQQANTIVDLAVSELCDERDGRPPYEPLP
ncbi:DUF732 domain-containing protein [Mycobacterium talmoniae]|uniref:DUF732 domain-containing protein n=1 Tax=Mycobacterium talmoniae TaxID=1858794 RepID=A0A1S1NP89_9MYCO|nr:MULTISPECIES: DUF732 domain-containing protein [Mycobacterium]OHV06222.1 hypothetical protein BKN37_02970 [Mycobacterium talmoniae]PQM48699.1 hypothetical protein C1Y40_01065 [Mycobacterium talmoniae]TDH57077.1 DUF732 domain-containing protein [Mycobacterium eburneum]